MSLRHTQTLHREQQESVLDRPKGLPQFKPYEVERLSSPPCVFQHGPDQGVLKATLARHKPLLRGRDRTRLRRPVSLPRPQRTLTLYSAEKMGFRLLAAFSSTFLYKSISRGTPFVGRRHSTLAPTDLIDGKTLCVSITFHTL